jgi:hypothetical protein
LSHRERTSLCCSNPRLNPQRRLRHPTSSKLPEHGEFAHYRRRVGLGGESLLQQKDGDIIVFHAYDGTSGDAYLQISTTGWVDGWPKVALEGGNPANR